jgi:G:T-mismatch repair DNA endonuclease (very short patch repair protein)
VTSSQATWRAWILMAHFCTTNISIHISIDRLDWVRLDQIGFDILYIWLNHIKSDLNKSTKENLENLDPVE